MSFTEVKICDSINNAGYFVVKRNANIKGGSFMEESMYQRLEAGIKRLAEIDEEL